MILYAIITHRMDILVLIGLLLWIVFLNIMLPFGHQLMSQKL
jgi:hypothetical protein